MRRPVLTLYLLILLSSAGCGAAIGPGQAAPTPVGLAPTPAPTAPASPSATDTASAPTSPPAPTGITAQPPFDSELEPSVQQARDDLAQRRGLAPDAIEVVEVRSVVWPDGGLGCPVPGMEYPQVQVEGLLIRLRAAGQTFDYHSGANRPPRLCEQPLGGG
jgi:hypothetical protein